MHPHSPHIARNVPGIKYQKPQNYTYITTYKYTQGTVFTSGKPVRDNFPVAQQ